MFETKLIISEYLRRRPRRRHVSIQWIVVLFRIVIPERVLWKLEAPLIYQGKKERFVVPAGFITDFASVPRILWWIFPPYGEFTKAAVVHDYLYDCGYVSRGDSDGIFRRIMRELHTRITRRWLMWLGVRALGWLAYGRKKQIRKYKKEWVNRTLSKISEIKNTNPEMSVETIDSIDDLKGI